MDFNDYYNIDAILAENQVQPHCDRHCSKYNQPLSAEDTM
jgi:hypothetical protein